MRVFVALLSIIGVAVARDAITVDPGSGSVTDLSGTGLSPKYCEAESDQTCALGVIEGNFAGTLFQCQARCTRRKDCLSVRFLKDRICELLDGRCDPLATGGDTSRKYLYRLKTGRSCPANSTPYKKPEGVYGNTFCMIWGKKCKGDGYYKTPAKITKMEDCLIKCAKIKECSMVNFADGMCEPLISDACPDEDLEDAEGTQNFLRLGKGESECPDNRGPPTTDPPPPVTVLPPTLPPTEPVWGDDCGGKKYVTKVRGKKGQKEVIGVCNPGCVMSVCHCGPWKKCNGAKFTSDGKCRVNFRTGGRWNKKKKTRKAKIYAHIKCVPQSKMAVQYISTQVPGVRLKCGDGYIINDCTFFAFNRSKRMKPNKKRATGGTVGCGIKYRYNGCNKTGRCTSSAVCFKKL